MDFVENYSFFCQDVVQDFHWDTSQALLHPVVANYRDNSDTMSCKCYWLISDEREHNAIVVHKFINSSPVNFFKRFNLNF